VSGQGPSGDIIRQETPCSVWDYGGGIMLRNLTTGVAMTLRASAPGYTRLRHRRLDRVQGYVLAGRPPRIHRKQPESLFIGAEVPDNSFKPAGAEGGIRMRPRAAAFCSMRTAMSPRTDCTTATRLSIAKAITTTTRKRERYAARGWGR
jgi:hypothetical protein